MNQEPIFILGLHKSGTSLLRNLFDGHTGLFVIPIESHIFQHNNYWIDYGIRRQIPSDANPGKIINNYLEWIYGCNTRHNDKLGDSVTLGLWDLDLFKNKMSKYNKEDFLDTKLSIEHYFESMYASLFKKELSDNIRVIEKSVENAEFAIDLKTMYPKAKFIHIVRNPYSNLVSIRKYKSKNKKPPVLKHIMDSMYNSYYHLEKNKRILKNDYLVVRYEDLVSDTETKMNEITDFLNITREAILYKPTVNGELWGGNSTTGKKFNKISNEFLDLWKSTITPLEIEMINKLFKRVLTDYHYEKFENEKSFLKRNKNESVKTYLSNRLLYRYFLK